MNEHLKILPTQFLRSHFSTRVDTHMPNHRISPHEFTTATPCGFRVNRSHVAARVPQSPRNRIVDPQYLRDFATGPASLTKKKKTCEKKESEKKRKERREKRGPGPVDWWQRQVGGANTRVGAGRGGGEGGSLSMKFLEAPRDADAFVIGPYPTKSKTIIVDAFLVAAVLF